MSPRILFASCLSLRNWLVCVTARAPILRMARAAVFCPSVIPLCMPAPPAYCGATTCMGAIRRFFFFGFGAATFEFLFGFLASLGNTTPFLRMSVMRFAFLCDSRTVFVLLWVRTDALSWTTVNGTSAICVFINTTQNKKITVLCNTRYPRKTKMQKKAKKTKHKQFPDLNPGHIHTWPTPLSYTIVCII